MRYVAAIRMPIALPMTDELLGASLASVFLFSQRSLLAHLATRSGGGTRVLNSRLVSITAVCAFESWLSLFLRCTRNVSTIKSRRR